LTLNPDVWHGSALGTECTFHQIAPYIGKMKSTMAKEIIKTYSSKGDVILDPFAGSGAVGLESTIAGRKTICTDVNPYAVILTRAKLTAPQSLQVALERANYALEKATKISQSASIKEVPEWVKAFFHPKTLHEITRFVSVVKKEGDSFLMASLLGILHHQRPGFLSYPSSHLVPYLRSKKFPKNAFPELYEYRPLKPRLIAKINRLYRRPAEGSFHSAKCYQADVRHFKLDDGCINTVVTSPPYMDALDYARDNRLRLWFLGAHNYKKYEGESRTLVNFSKLMTDFLHNSSNWLSDKGYCICVVGEVNRQKRSVDIANLIANIATKEMGTYKLESIVTDEIPDIRRSRKGSYVKTESIVVLQKRGG
jgi:hypothetical protein